MKSNRSQWVMLLVVFFTQALHSPAQQADADRKLVEKTKANVEKGDALAQWAIGKFYFDGRGVPKDTAEAAKWFRKAAEQGDASAQCQLGICYDCGEGVTKDYTEAAKWYRKAAEQDHAFAQFLLGLQLIDGAGATRNMSEAVSWWRKAAEQGQPDAQFNLGACYRKGEGVDKDSAVAARWFCKAADQGYAEAQFNLGFCYMGGDGVIKNAAEAVKWWRKAAQQGYPNAQCNLGACYARGDGVDKDAGEAVKWYHEAAKQGNARAQYALGICFSKGDGLAKDFVEAFKWENLASAQGHAEAKNAVALLEPQMTGEQIAKGQQLARNFTPRKAPEVGSVATLNGMLGSRPAASGSGFFITDDGFLVTNEHVVKGAMQVRLVCSTGVTVAKLMMVDAANDIALLKAVGRFSPLPVTSSRTVRLGSAVATVGFPNIDLQGLSPKLAKGEISSLSGPVDDPKYFQISAPIQPGNSGGPLVDGHGNVVGIVSATLDVATVLSVTGTLPENINYAVKSGLLLSFLESVPEVFAKLKEPNTKDRKFEDIVQSIEQAAVLVLVY